jgi:hypothetical protein
MALAPRRAISWHVALEQIPTGNLLAQRFRRGLNAVNAKGGDEGRLAGIDRQPKLDVDTCVS